MDLTETIEQTQEKFRNLASKHQALVSEVFGPTIQGEGPFQGRRAFFLRLQQCTSPICYFCDSKSSTSIGGELWSWVAIRARLEQLGMADGDLLVITGGEPFLQFLEGIIDTIQEGRKTRIIIQVETSAKTQGMVVDSLDGIPANIDHVVCSPKYLGHQWWVDSTTIDALLGMQGIGADTSISFKFPVENTESVEAVKAFVRSRGIPAKIVWLMPLGVLKQTQVDSLASIADLAVQNGFNFSTRLHILAGVK